MIRAILAICMALSCMIGVGCSNMSSSPNNAAASDPFAGFFAHPSVGMLELTRADGAGKYKGLMWADFGPFPVELTREDTVARGTVTYAGESHPLQVESTVKGLVISADGTDTKPPMQRYKDMAAYQKWFAAQGGYEATIEVTTQP